MKKDRKRTTEQKNNQDEKRKDRYKVSIFNIITLLLLFLAIYGTISFIHFAYQASMTA